MDVRLIGNGAFDNIEQQVDPTHKAARVSLRPPEIGIYGSFRKHLKSGVIAAGIANSSPVWELRWGRSDIICIVRKLRIQAIASTTAFAATAADSSFSLYKAQGFTAMDGTGGTFAAWTKTKSGVVASRMASSQMSADSSTNRANQGGIVIANTGALSGGTKTLDDDPIGCVLNRIVASAAAETIITPEPAPYLIDPAETPVQHPIELTQNEGLVLQVDAMTGTGTWRLAVEVAWDEVDPQKYF